MRKKIMVFLSVIAVCLVGLFNHLVVYAQEEEQFPDRYLKLNFVEYIYMQEYDRTLEYRVVYTLPYRVANVPTINEFVFFYRFAYGFYRGRDDNNNAYRLTSTLRSPGRTEFQFRMTIRKDLIDSEYPDGDLTDFFAEHSAMYIRSDYVDPEIVMKNFLLAELYEDFAYEETIGLEKYYVYLDAQVYLPNGMKRSITVMPDIIDDNPDVFEGYDFIAVSFNLSPRARFWSPDIYPNDPIVGLSYIVYDLVANTTTFYNYQGNAVVQLNRITYLDNPQFAIPEAEAIQYREKASYEAGKNEGYRQGREEGERAGKRKMQEEMQQVIDNLIEYYEEEVRKAYNRGRNEADFENLDIFGYLQALFGEQGLGRLLKLELLPGVSLGAVIMIPLAFWLVSFIMRWFR